MLNIDRKTSGQLHCFLLICRFDIYFAINFTELCLHNILLIKFTYKDRGTLSILYVKLKICSKEGNVTQAYDVHFIVCLYPSAGYYH